MSTKKETKKTKFDWGDGHKVTVRKPKLKEVPGTSMMCPVICDPVGEDDDEWERNERKSKRPIRTSDEDN